MIHFTCDGCDRRIDTSQETRYVFRLEVYTAPDSACEGYGPGLEEDPAAADLAAIDTDRDHLAEIDDLLEHVDGFDDSDPGEPLAEDYRQVRYDLCRGCRDRMLSNPLARLTTGKITFSDN